jgi:hypothetical protein
LPKQHPLDAFFFGEKKKKNGDTHCTLYRKNKGHDDHISWDRKPNSDYRDGTGHQDKDGKKVKTWP